MGVKLEFISAFLKTLFVSQKLSRKKANNSGRYCISGSQSVANLDWQFISIPLALSNEGGDQIKIEAVTTPSAGYVLLDNTKITTRQHCIPRYVY